MEKNTFVVTASAQYLNQGLNELQELDGSVRTVKLLENGIAIIETQLSKYEFIRIIKAKRPVFIRHMNAVDYIIDIEAGGPQTIAKTAG